MKIRITKGKGWYRDEVGEVFEVTGRCKSVDAHYVKVWDDDDDRWVTDSYFVRDGYYEIVGEPKTHIIDGKTFVEVERKANIGDKVIVVELDEEGEGGDFRIGNILNVTNIGCFTVRTDGHFEDGSRINLLPEEYRVLEPVDNELFTDRLLEIISNLTRRVSSLESQLRDTQNNAESHGVEIANVTHKVAKHDVMFGIVEDNIEMVISDIVTLDERTQVLNAVNSHYKDGDSR